MHTLPGFSRSWALFALWITLLPYSSATDVDPAKLDACPGYQATNVKINGGSLTADLNLAGQACNVFGEDLQKLSLSVAYETSKFFSRIYTTQADNRYR